MKTTVALLSLIFAAFCVLKPTDKKISGSKTVDLPIGVKIISASYKNDTLWCLYRTAKADETPEVVIMEEFSQYGNRKVIFNEH